MDCERDICVSQCCHRWVIVCHHTSSSACCTATTRRGSRASVLMLSSSRASFSRAWRTFSARRTLRCEDQFRLPTRSSCVPSLPVPSSSPELLEQQDARVSCFLVMLFSQHYIDAICLLHHIDVRLWTLHWFCMHTVISALVYWRKSCDKWGISQLCALVCNICLPFLASFSHFSVPSFHSPSLPSTKKLLEVSMNKVSFSSRSTGSGAL